MVEIWYAIVGLLLGAYVVLDGFDLGVGIVHRLLGRTPEERAATLATVHPFWDGNEVCLIAAGGVLFLSFPTLLGSALSGFYLPIFFVLWSLLLRGLSIELRGQLHEPLWRSFFDTVFSLSSALLVLFFGVALANVLRGVPLEDDGYFSLVLFTQLSPRGEVGLLDGYTVLTGLFAVVALALHGAVYLSWKAPRELAERASKLARKLVWAALPLWLATTAMTFWLRPELGVSLQSRPLVWLLAALTLVALGVFATSLRQGLAAARRTFVASCATLLGVLATTFAALFPLALPSSRPGHPGLTAFELAAPASSLRTGLLWWPFAALLAIGYFSLLFWLHRGRIEAHHD